MKRIWSIILTLCLLAGMAPPFTKAAETPTPADTAALSSEADVVDGQTIAPNTTNGTNTVDVGGRTDDVQDAANSQDAAEADSDTLSGTCGDNLTWRLSNGVLTISGTGSMADFVTASAVPWYNSRTSIQNVVMERGVTSIAYSAFNGCSNLTSVEIPNGVTEINNYTFQDCRSLTSLTIPESVTYIGSYAFNNCSSLTSLTIPEGVTYIGDFAFRNCSSLTNVTIPNSVTSILGGTFLFCNRLTNVTIPDSVTEIAGGAFSSCSSLISVNIGNENTAYSSENGILFNKDKTVLVCYPAGKQETAYTIPNNVTTIGNSAFYGCSILTGVTIPDSVTSVGYSAFYNCSGLTSVTLPDNVTTIDMSTFYNCNSLASMTIPVNVTSVGQWAFRDCSALAEVYYSGTRAQWNAVTLDDTDDGNAALHSATIHCTDGDIVGGAAATFVVTFNGNGGAPETTTVAVTSGETVPAPANPTRDGYEFTGWYTDPQAGTVFDFTAPITANTNLYAQWREVPPVPDFTVTFDGNGGTPQTSAYVVEMNTTVSPPATNPARDGYEFTGWYTDPQAANAFDFTTPITDNTTLYAGWRQHDIPVYAVTFEANGGGSTMNPVTVSGNSYTLPQCGFTPPSHMIFGAWSVNGTEYAPGETISLSGNVTVTALWVDPYGVLGRLQDMDSYMDQTWHLAGPFPEFRTLTIDDTTLTQPDDYTSESGSTKLNIPAGTFARFGEGTHSIAAEFQTSDPGDDGRRVTADYYTVKPSGQVTLDAREITGADGVEAAKAVENVSYTGRFHTVPQLNEEYFRVVVTEGAVPSGLTLHEGGYFTGTPFIAEGQPRTFTFTVGLQVRRNVTDAWPETYADTVEVTIAVEQDTQANVEAQADPGYELVERVPATIELDGEWVHLTSKGPFEEFTDFYIDGVKKVRGVDYTVRPCLINPATDEVVQLLEGGLMTGTFIQLQKSTLGEGTHSLNLEFVKTDPIGNKQTRNASQKVTVRPKSTPVVTPIHNSSGGSGSSGSSGSSSRSTTPTVRTYTVKVSKASNGTLTLSATKVAAGKSVTITATPKSGYRTESVSVRDSAKKTVKTTQSGNQYTFTMPSRNVTVSASFTPSVYSLTVAASQHGKVTLNRDSASRGTTINGSTTPDKGYLLLSVAVRDANGQSVNVETFNDGKFTFLMPQGRVTVSATFAVKRLAKFEDIQGPDWFFDDAEWAYNRGILRGVTEQYWEPQSLMSSVTSIVTLERLDGVDLTPYDTGADDGLDNSAWYVAALRWANANGITLSDRPFGGQAALKRGEFAVMLSNYLHYRGIAVEVPEGATFSDAATMTEDELRAFRTLQAADVFRGYRDGSIRPEAYLNRAQLAALLHRLSGYIIGAETA